MITPLYGQLSPLRIPTSSRFISADADVVAYVLAVESADGQQLEAGVISAVDAFISGCKSDGIWNAIKASCILAGARSLSGALVPLVGAAPTNFNFVTGDYNRETGLKGDGSTKYLNANRNNDSDPTARHIYCRVTNPATFDSGTYIGMSLSANATTVMARTNRTDFRIQTGTISISGSPSIGGYGVARSSDTATQVIIANNVTNRADTRTASASNSGLGIFATTSPGFFNDCRLSFYSIGENLNLTSLNSRVSTLMTDLAAAI